MSPKTATKIYVCTKCDAQSPKWTGQCLECGAWGTVEPARADWNTPSGVGRGPASGSRNGQPGPIAAAESVPLDQVNSLDAERTPTGISEVDRVLGGGLVAGSVTLLGGEPGIGKSTMALILAARLAAKTTDQPVLYVSGEESAAQVKLRADRLQLQTERLLFMDDTDCDKIAAALEKDRPAFTVVDSVQTLHSQQIPSEAGALNQVRYAAGRLIQAAKRSERPLLIIGHVTKDGQVAGPKTLEHLVDTVLAFEGERSHNLRLLRSLKNRFGPTDETGIFEMLESGLEEIKNPSAYLLDERNPGTSGSAVTCVIEGTRPVLLEVQALVQRTSFGYPTRRATGFDQARLEMLLAVLGNRGDLDLSQHDVYINVVGGLKIKERSADLAVAAAVVSAARGQALPGDAAIWGEIGLSGEVRAAPATDRRLREAANLGLKSVIAPAPAAARPNHPRTSSCSRSARWPSWSS
jgi:DNA repair protein RadA/Sms